MQGAGCRVQDLAYMRLERTRALLVLAVPREPVCHLSFELRIQFSKVFKAHHDFVMK